MPYRVVAADALAAWREADRRMSELPVESPKWQEACREAALSKQRYNDAVAAAHAEHLPEPPPWIEASIATD